MNVELERIIAEAKQVLEYKPTVETIEKMIRFAYVLGRDDGIPIGEQLARAANHDEP